MHEDAVRLLYHAATVKVSGNVDNEGLIGRAREDHRFGFRKANIFRHYQADPCPGVLGWFPIRGPTPMRSRKAMRTSDGGKELQGDPENDDQRDADELDPDSDKADDCAWAFDDNFSRVD